MAKPTLPRWADVSGDIVEPISGKKDVGWVEEERPPNSYVNWFWNKVYEWAKWLDDNFTDDAQPKPEQEHLRAISHFERALDGQGWDKSISGDAPFMQNADATAEPAIMPIDLMVGERIKEWGVLVKDDSNPYTIDAKLWKRTAAAAPVQIGSTQSSDGGGGLQTLSETLGTPEVGITNTQYWVAVENADSAPASQLILYNGYFKTDRA